MNERYTEKKKSSYGRSKNPTKKSENRLGCFLIIIGVIVFILVYFGGFLDYRAKRFCTKAESDAKVVASALIDYFSEPYHKTTPTFDQLRKWTSVALSGENTATITGTDPNHILIMVTDGSGRCPVAYQEAETGWDGNGVYKFTTLID